MNTADVESAPTVATPKSPAAVQRTQSGVERLSELDALRGIAALSVVFWHFFCATCILKVVWPLYYVSRGDGAVVLFFC